MIIRMDALCRLLAVSFFITHCGAARNCREIFQLYGYGNGEHIIDVDDNGPLPSFRVYCHDMTTTGDQSTWLTLNYTLNNNAILKNYGCRKGLFNTSQTDVYSYFEKLRFLSLDPGSILFFRVARNDPQGVFAQNSGSNLWFYNSSITYTSLTFAGCCDGRNVPCGSGNIDLRGTPFFVDMNFTRPTANGVYFAPGNTTSSFNGKVIDLTGGGDCGWHQLLNLTLALDDAYMGVPLTEGTCIDAFKNANETGVDCGGQCPPCPYCTVDSDCSNGFCNPLSNQCAALQESGLGTGAIIAIAVVIFVLLCVAVGAAIMFRMKKRKEGEKSAVEGLVTVEQGEVLPSIDVSGESSSIESSGGEYLDAPMDTVDFLKYILPGDLIDHKDLRFGRILGEGSYGTVYKGKYQNNPVALKMSKVACREDIIDLLKEAQLAISLPQNKNIANYIGVAVKDGKPVIVMELVTGGTLQNALLNKELSFVELHNIVLGIANGMNVLNKARIVHRDLAARNILLTPKSKTPKITDFGMSRAVDYRNTANYTKKAFGPIAWMAPENLNMQYSSASDVWSFGVLLWEVITWGEVPYGDKDINVIAVKIRENTLKLKIPLETPTILKRLMKECWNAKPAERPTFGDIIQMLEENPWKNVIK